MGNQMLNSQAPKIITLHKENTIANVDCNRFPIDNMILKRNSKNIWIDNISNIMLDKNMNVINCDE